MVEVFADEITRSPVHTAGAGRNPADPNGGLALRFPRIVRGVRADRTPEDATSEDEVIRLFQLQKRYARYDQRAGVAPLLQGR